MYCTSNLVSKILGAVQNCDDKIEIYENFFEDNRN